MCVYVYVRECVWERMIAYTCKNCKATVSIPLCVHLAMCCYVSSNSLIMINVEEMGTGSIISPPSFGIPWSHFQYNYSISEIHRGLFQQTVAMAIWGPICGSLSVWTYFTSVVRIFFNIVVAYPGDILHTNLIKVTILPSILFKKSIYSI